MAAHPNVTEPFRVQPLQREVDVRVCNRDAHPLHELQSERALASLEGLTANVVYMADLDGEIVVTCRAYVGAAVTEIATLRAELSGPRVG
jgi:hypothetical protein